MSTKKSRRSKDTECATIAYKYIAFISYTRADAMWAHWLHKALERYRIPKLIGGDGKAIHSGPRCLGRVFRDREELGASASPDASINVALRESKYLIVICSPRSAKADWVNREIKRFKAMGRENRVFCLVVDGKPNATDDPSTADQECLPEAARFRINSRGLLTDQRAEFVAPDVRAAADGKTDSLLKLIAGMLDIGFDDLKKREEKQRWKNRVKITLLGALLIVSLLCLTLWALNERTSAKNALSTSLFQQGVALSERGNAPDALAYLSESLINNHRNSAAVRSIVTILSNSSFCTPACRPIKHDKEVLDAEFSPDGRRIVTASGNAAWVWDAKTGKFINKLEHDYIGSVNFRKARKKNSKSITPNDIGVDEWLALIGANNVKKATFSPDGKRILTAGYRKICLWNIASGSLIRQVKTFDSEEGLSQSCFSRNGRWLSATLSLNASSIVDLDTGDAVGLSERKDSGQINAIYSRDGRKILTIDGNLAEVWNGQSGSRITALKHPKSPRVTGYSLTCGRFSPDGQHIIATCGDNSITVWDSSSGKPIKVITASHRVKSLDVSSDGSTILSLCDDTVRLYDADMGRLRFVLSHGADPTAACFDSSSRLVAVSYNDNTVEIWDAKNGECLCEPINHPAVVTKVVFSPHDKQLLTVCSDGIVRLWNVRPQTLPVVMRHKDSVDQLAFSNDGKLLLTMAQSEFKQWKTGWSKPLYTYRHENRYSNWTGFIGASFSKDGNWACNISIDNVLRMWNSKTGKVSVELPGHDVWYYDCTADFSADSSLFVCPMIDRRVIYLLDLKRTRAVELKNQSSVKSLQFIGKTHQLLAVCDYGPATVWDCDRLRRLCQLNHDAEVYTAQASPDGKQFVTCSNLGNVRVWDAETYRPLANLNGQGSGCRASWLPNGDVLISSRRGSRRFASRGNKYVAINLFSLAEQPDGKLAFNFPMSDMDMLIWNPKKLGINWEYTSKYGQIQPKFSDDGKLLLRSVTDNEIQMCETSTGRILKSFQHDRKVRSASFSSDGEWISTVSGNCVRLWHSGSGELVALMPHSKETISSAFSKDGRWLITSGEDKCAKLWYMGEDPNYAPEWISDLAQAVAGRRLTDGMLVGIPDQFAARKKLMRALEKANQKDPWVRWGKWVLADQQVNDFYMP